MECKKKRYIVRFINDLNDLKMVQNMNLKADSLRPWVCRKLIYDKIDMFYQSKIINEAFRDYLLKSYMGEKNNG